MSLIMSSHNDAPNMQSYPSPNAVAADAGGPFYNSGNNNGSQSESRLSNPDDIQLAAQISRGLAPQMGANNGPGIDARDAAAQAVANANHYAQQQEQAQAAQMEGSMDQSFDGSMAPRKRSKVSRACDECRRKKIRCDATTESGDEQCSSCKRVGTRCQFSRVPMKRGPSKGYIKELADRLNNLESSMQSGEIQYTQMQHDSTPPQGQEDYSPPPNGGPSRKRTYSTISNDFGASIQNHRASVGWNPQDPQRNVPPTGPYPATPDQSQIGYRPQYSPNGMAPQPVWANGPDVARRPSAAFDGYPHSNSNHPEIRLEWNDVFVERYYTFIHPTLPLLSTSKARFRARINNCPSPLREACFEALYGAVRSVSPIGTPARHEPQTNKKVADLMAQFESESIRTMATNLVQLQIMLLMAIEAEIHGPASSRAYGASKSFWHGSAVGFAYSMKLHVMRTIENSADPEADSDDLLARRIWWTLVIMDRWHASSTSSPLLIPETSVVILPDDQAILGDGVYHFSRLSIILGHLATVIVAPGDPTLPNSSLPLIFTLLTGELERFRESFPHSLPPSHLPLLHLAYFHVRLLMKRHAPTSTNEELLTPAMQIASMLSQNPGLVTPLSHHFAAVAAITLVELRDEKSEKEAESGLSLIIDYVNSLARSPSATDAPKDWYSIITNILLRRDRANSNAEGKATQNRARAERLSIGADAQEISRGSLQHLADLATASEEVLGERNEVLAVAVWDPSLLTKGGYMNVLAEGR